LEDKIVKYFFKSLSENKSVSRYVPKLEQPDTLFSMLEKKPKKPSLSELKENFPSRSAKLRYIIKKNDLYKFETDIFQKFSYLIEIENFGNKL
jgi:16S rRNA (cytosine1402-N4)-methyltransferase